MAVLDYTGFEARDETVIWRYVSRSRFRELVSGQLYFAAAHQFDDAFEGAIAQAEQANRKQTAERVFPGDHDAVRQHLRSVSEAFADLRRMTKINCWHVGDHENIAMWERYARADEKHLGVAVASTVGALKQSLHEFRLQPTYGEESIYVGAVRYVDFAAEAMTDPSMLGIFLHKRVEFRDESEVRALLSLRIAVEWGVEIPDDGASVSVDPHELVQQVRAHPKATDREVDELIEMARAAGCKCPVTASSLGVKPTY